MQLNTYRFLNYSDKLNTWAEIWRELTVKEVRRLRSAFDSTPTCTLTLAEVCIYV